MNASEMAQRLSDLWDDERCEWKLAFESSRWRFSEEAPWTLTLTWTEEGGSPHHADFTTYDWQFYALVSEGGPDHVLRQAVDWCEALLPFKRCDECGGDGEYGRDGGTVTCEACAGSGLAVVSA